MRQHTENFICSISKDEQCLPGIRTLLQHACAKIPDRAGYRVAISKTVSNIISAVPQTMKLELIAWIGRYSRNHRIGCRVTTTRPHAHTPTHSARSTQYTANDTPLKSATALHGCWPCFMLNRRGL